jgi:SAM-dependent methyltransferase
MRSAEMEPFDYFFCSQCHSLSICEIPEDLGRYYENYYSFCPVEDKDSRLRKLAKRLALTGFQKLGSCVLNTPSDLSILALAHCHLNPAASILDVGCGTGQLVFDLHEAGFKNVCGIDPFVESDLVHSNGSRVFKKTLYEETGTWDLIMLNHVFEHIEHPDRVLQQIRRLLKPNGVAMIRVPNADSYAYRKYRGDWYGIQAPLHFFLPSIQGMEKLAQNAGLKIQGIKGENLLEFWAHSIAYSLNIWDYHPLGMRTFLRDHTLKCLPSFLTRSELKALKELNCHIQKSAELCDWAVYFLVPSSEE